MLLFLSHSGADTEAAIELKRRILAAPEARASGLRVWLDVDDLKPGGEWQPQLEEAAGSATAFCVYLGARGVVNWVDREVRLGLSRATGEDPIPFIPVRASKSIEWDALPPFARQFHGITDPLGDEAQLAALIAAALARPERPAALTDEPFVGLRAMGEAEADRFFGRDAEIEELVRLVRAHPLVAVVADSGAGKSSLVRAGLLPAFRGGALESAEGLRDGRARHAVVMRPGADPAQGLKDGIDRAARGLGLGPDVRRALRQSVDLTDPGETAYALRCDLDAEITDVLLVVDQFEELLTEAERDIAVRFVDLLLALANSGAGRRVRIVLTVRADYYNLIRAHEALFARLEADEGAAQLRLKRISDAGLADVVHRPLAMAGHDDAEERAALLEAIRRDTPDRPGDLALVQMALYATWRKAKREGTGLLRAYADVHGVLGALAHEAERARQEVLDAEEREILLPLFARLVRLGETGGATRRTATLVDLDPARAALARKLATEEAGRLLMVGEETVEIAHEALVAQWPWLQQEIQEAAADIRTLARLGDNAEEWRASGRAGRALPNEAERQDFRNLIRSRPGWSSASERALVRAAGFRVGIVRAAAAAAVVAIVVAGLAAFVFAIRAFEAEDDAILAKNEAEAAAKTAEEATVAAVDSAERAKQAARIAANNAAGGLAALASIAAEQDEPDKAAKLALAAWPRSPDTEDIQLKDVIRILSDVTPQLRERAWMRKRATQTWGAGFSPGGELFAVQTDETVLVDVETGQEVTRFKGYTATTNFAFSPDGGQFATGSRRVMPHLWDTSKGADVFESGDDSGYVTSVAYSADGSVLVSARPDGTISIWDPEGHALVERHSVDTDETLWAVAASPDGTRIATGDRGGTVRVWDARTWEKIGQFSAETSDQLTYLAFSPDGSSILTVYNGRGIRFWDAHTFEVRGVEELGSPTAFAISTDGSRIAIGGPKGSIQLLDARSGSELFSIEGHQGAVTSLAFSSDGARLLTGGRDGTARLWSLSTREEAARFDESVSSVAAVKILADGERFAIGYVDGTVRTLHLEEDATVRWRKFGKSNLKAVALSPDGTRLAIVSDDQSVQIFDPITGAAGASLAFSDHELSTIALSPDGRFLASHSDERPILVQEVGSGTTVARFNWDYPNGLSMLAFSPEASRLAAGSGHRSGAIAAIWDIDTERQVWRLDSKGGGLPEVVGVTFSLDGTWILAEHSINSGYSVKHNWYDLTKTPAQRWNKWSFYDPEEPYVGLFGLGSSRSISFSPDGARAAGVEGETIRLWDTNAGAQIARFTGYGAPIQQIAFSPQPGRLVSVARDGTVGLWNLSSVPDGTAFDVVCALLPDHDLGDVLADYPITIDEPICDEGYEPPLPHWMTGPDDPQTDAADR